MSYEPWIDLSGLQIIWNKIKAYVLRESSVMVLDFGTINSLPVIFYNSRLSADLTLVDYEIGNSSAQVGDWSVISAAGSVTVTGSISGSTTLKVKLQREFNLTNTGGN